MKTTLATLLLGTSLSFFAQQSIADDTGGCASQHHTDTQNSAIMEMEMNLSHAQASSNVAYAKDSDLLMDAMVPDNIDALLGSQKIDNVTALNLNEDQKQKIEQLSTQLRNNNLDRIGKITGFADKLHALYDQKQPNANAIDDNFKHIFDLKREMIGEVIQAEEAIYAVLSDTQRNMLLGNSSEFKAMH